MEKKIPKLQKKQISINELFLNIYRIKISKALILGETMEEKDSILGLNHG